MHKLCLPSLAKIKSRMFAYFIKLPNDVQIGYQLP